MNSAIKQYAVITASYWAFTLTDGALRMLVVLYFHQLGYSPLEIASLFLLYEFCGVITNLIGGWLATHIGLNKSMHLGLALQIIALCMMLVDSEQLSVLYVMVAQAVSGIAKDFNKMSAKSSIKLLVPKEEQGKLYQWVALLTGSKNTLKGIGFFLGAFLLSQFGFRLAIIIMAIALAIVLLFSFILLRGDLGKTKFKVKFTDIFSKSAAVNRLSAARFFLFGARDIWFVIALPVFLQEQLHWQNNSVGFFLASWVIAYGLVQTIAPKITGLKKGKIPDGQTAWVWALGLLIATCMITVLLALQWQTEQVLIIGLIFFGALFAINSSVHSYLIVAYAKEDHVSLDVGFYYMANAFGRLVGTLLSGWIYQNYSLSACLASTGVFILIATLISVGLPREQVLG
jgi:predicted MFS family arabinose efflux permease